MSEFSTEFSFDLQRFAVTTFTGGDIGGEEGVTLSDLFNDNGKAATKPGKASEYTGDNRFFWNSSSLVELTPTLDNASETVAGAVQLVAGKFDTLGALGSGSAGYVISALTAVDASNLTGKATFSTIGNTKIVNPAGTIAIGDNTVQFSGSGAKENDSSLDWAVGTVINTSSNKITTIAAAAGEEVTTAPDTKYATSATFNADGAGGTVTLNGKYFNTITANSNGDSVGINISSENATTSAGQNAIFLAVEADTSVKAGNKALTVAFNDQAIKSVSVTGGKSDEALITYGGTTIVGNDVTIQGSAVNVAGIQGASTATINYVVNAQGVGGDILDVAGASYAKANKPVEVSKTGKAKFLIAADINDSEDITIGGTGYKFEDAGSNGGVFEVSGNAVTGFVFRDNGDSITLPQGASIKFYYAPSTSSSGSDGLVGSSQDYSSLSLDNLETADIKLTVNSDGEYTVAKTDTGYEVEVTGTATVEVGGATMEFTLPTTKANKKNAPTSAKITISNDGLLQSVTAGNNAAGESTDTSFDVSGTQIKFSGMNSDNVSENFSVDGVTFATDSGSYNYLVQGEKEGVQSDDTALQMTSSDDAITKLEKADGDTSTTKVLLAETTSEGDEQPAGTLTFEGVEYKYSSPQGNAHLDVTATGVQFVFVDAGDTITIPEEDDGNITLKYQDNGRDATEETPNLTTAPTIDGDITITMTKATTSKNSVAEFEVFDIAADSVLTSGNGTFTFSADGGKFAFTSATAATGFTAKSGTVTMNQDAANLLARTDEDAALFKIDGTGVNITATADSTGNVVYSKDTNSLAGLADGSAIIEAGSITRVYAPVDREQAITFGTGDDAKIYTAFGDGDLDKGTLAYFTVSGNTATGFTFIDVDDEITAESFADIRLYDTASDTTGFAAPVVTDGSGNEQQSTIVKDFADYDGNGDKDCYSFIAADFAPGTNVAFEDGTKVTFNDTQPDTDLYFSTAGKMLSIVNLDEANNEVVVAGATSSVLIDNNEIQITGPSSSFTFHMQDDTTPAILDVYAGSTIVKAAGVSIISTAAGTSGIGDFTFGDKTFTVDGDDNNGVEFGIFGISVTSVSGVDGNESVTGALGNLSLNGTSIAVAGGEDDIYTFSGTSLAGLTDGDKVTNAGNITDFITESEGAFAILGTSMAIASDSSVVFKVAGGSLTGVYELDGTATGDFTKELEVNDEDILIAGDSSIAVNASGSKVDAITEVGGGSISLTKIGSATLVATDSDGVFDFVEGEQTFGTSTSDGVTFGIEDKKVVSITGIDQEGERVWGNFNDGIDVDGNLVQVENSEDIIYVKGSHSGISGTGIYGLKDGANVISASGINVAVAVGQSGSYTFGSQSFTILNDSNEHVGFLLDNGKVTDIFDVDGTVLGNLNGVTINQQAPEISVVGGDGDNTHLVYSDGLLTGLRDGDTVVSADNVSTVRAIEAGTFFFGGKSFTTDDADGIDFLVDKGTTNVTGVADLADGASLTGSLSSLTAVNGASFIIRNDDDFGIVGATSGVKEIFDVSGGAEVVNAGGASKVTTDKKGAFTFGGQLGGETFTTEDDDIVEFALDSTGAVTGINGLSGGVVANNANFNNTTINGQSFAITGDEDDLKVVGTDAEDGISALEKVGGSVVNINNAGGATSVKTDKAGSFTFTKSGQGFLTLDTELDFTLDDTEKVTEIANLDGDITGNFSEVDRVNTQTVRITDNDNILTITGKGASSVTKISDVDAGATITNVGGASQVITKTAGSFSFAGHANPFITEGDDAITFDMVAGEDAKVRAITGIDDGSVTGNLNDVESINGQSFAIANDDDDSFTFEKNGSAATVSGVAGDDVQITALAGASTVELAKDGKYTFGDKAYDIATGDAATIGVNGLSVTSIEGLNRNDESVTGDFTSGISVGGKNFQVTGDSSITVAQEDDRLVIRGLNDGATIVAADGVSKATTEEAGTFTDTDDHELTIGNGDAIISLNGAAHIIGVSGVTGGVGGDINGLPINGNSSALVNVISAPDGQPSTNVVYNPGNKTLAGVVPSDTVISAGDATMVVATGEDGYYQFGADSSDDPKVFTIAGDTNGALNFTVEDGNVVTAVSDIDDGATLTGELNGIAVNDANVSIKGDDVYGVVGNTDADSISRITNVGGSAVTIVSAAGAEEVVTDTTGTFTFDKTGQKFVVSGDSSVVFGINDEERVGSISDLEGTVTGKFNTAAISVNGSAVQVAGDNDGNDVIGDENGVFAVNDVNAGSTVIAGNATKVGAKGEGTYTFYHSGDKFTIDGDESFNFLLDGTVYNNVTGVESVTSSTIEFNTNTTRSFGANPTINEALTFANNNENVSLGIDSEGKLVAIAGTSNVSGVEDAVVSASGPVVVNDKGIDIIDADGSYSVVVTDFEVEKIAGVTGDAIISVADASIEADSDGTFYVGGESYVISDNDNNFALMTGPTGDLTGINSLEGAIAVQDAGEELTVNGQYVDFTTGSNSAVTLASDGTNLAVAGLVDGDTISGDLANASIAVPGNEGDTTKDPINLKVNDINYEVYGDEDGVIVNGAGGVVGLDEDAYMVVQNAGPYTVNGETFNAVVGDTIVGSDKGAYFYDPDNILVRKSTPLSTIADITGIPTNVEDYVGSPILPAGKAETDSLLAADSGFDWNRPIAVFATNPDSTVSQDLDLSPYGFSKKVYLFDGPQSVAFNNAGGNFAYVSDTDVLGNKTSGFKQITLGNSVGDVVVIDQTAGINNGVTVTGGTGDDTIFVRDGADTTIDMSAGGADKVVTFARANARIKLEGYDYTTGAGVKFDQHEARNVANAINDGTIAFGDGVVSLKTAKGASEVSINSALGGTQSVGSSTINLFTPEGVKQKVAFSHSGGGVASVDAADTDDVILIGNSNGKKAGPTAILGGAGNDTAIAGAGDLIGLGGGNDVVSLQSDKNRKGAFINIAEGTTAIYGANNTLDEIHGDTLGVDLTAMDLVYDGSNLIIKSKEGAINTVLATVMGAAKDGTISYDLASSADLAESADETTTGSTSSATTTTGSTSTAIVDPAAVISPLTSNAKYGDYTNQLIQSGTSLRKVAIGSTGSVIDVKLDEDVRADYYIGDNSGLTFGSYNGRVLLDLEGDQFTSVIDEQAVNIEGINSIQAGTQFNYIKGSDENETFIAGRGETHLYGDGGKNMLVGYSGLDKEGQTTFYVLGHAADGVNTVQAFDFVDDDNYTNNNKITADKMEVDLHTNFVSRVDLSNNDVVMEVTNLNGSATESVLIKGVVDSVTGYGQDILVSGDGVVADVIAQVGNDKLKFDKFANYYNATGKNATVDVANDKDYAAVWLNNVERTGTTFVGDVRVINAADFTGTAELAGNDSNNTIIAGSGATSLWGGNYGDDALVAGTGANRFYYTIGNGNDTIIGAKDGDIVDLAGVQLDQIDVTGSLGSLIEENRLTIAFKDNVGGKLVIEGTSDVGYVVQGQTYYLNENRTGFVKKA